MFKTFAKVYIFSDQICYSYWHIKLNIFEHMRKGLKKIVLRCISQILRVAYISSARTSLSIFYFHINLRRDHPECLKYRNQTVLLRSENKRTKKLGFVARRNNVGDFSNIRTTLNEYLLEKNYEAAYPLQKTIIFFFV